jgi:hypothetical protein
MMNKKLVVVLMVVLAVLATSFILKGDSAEDYKIIKRSAKGKKISNPTWFKLEITEKHSKKAKVKIKVPVALIDLMADCIDEDDVKVKKDGCDIDLKKVIKILKKHGSSTLIEIDGDDCIVRLAFE